MDKRLDSAQQTVSDLLQYFGDDPERAGLKDTPRRFIRALAELLQGYKEPMPRLTTFDTTYDQMVTVSNISCISLCEHHILPIIIDANVGYIPDKKIAGLSKIPRLIQWCCARLVVQEELTGWVADLLMEHLKPQGVAVVLRGRHLCMETRGVKTRGTMTTSALRGLFKEPKKVPGLHPVEEFLQHCAESRGGLPYSR